MDFFGIEDFEDECLDLYNLRYNDKDDKSTPLYDLRLTNKWEMCLNNGTLFRIYNDIIRLYSGDFTIVPTYNDFLNFAAKCHNNPYEITNDYHSETNSTTNYIDYDHEYVFDMYNYILHVRDSTGSNEGYLFNNLSFKHFNVFLDKFYKNENSADYDISDEEFYDDDNNCC